MHNTVYFGNDARDDILKYLVDNELANSIRIEYKNDSLYLYLVSKNGNDIDSKKIPLCDIVEDKIKVYSDISYFPVEGNSNYIYKVKNKPELYHWVASAQKYEIINLGESQIIKILEDNVKAISQEKLSEILR